MTKTFVNKRKKKKKEGYAPVKLSKYELPGRREKAGTCNVCLFDCERATEAPVSIFVTCHE